MENLANKIVLQNINDKYRVEFFIIFSILAIGAPLITGIINLFSGNVYLFCLTLIFAIIMLVNLISVFWHKKYKIAINFFILAIVFLISFMTTRMTVLSNTMGWFVTVELIVVYLAGRKNSIFITVLFIAFLLLFHYSTPAITGGQSGIPLLVLNLTIICIIFSWAVLYFYLTIYDKKDSEVEEKNIKLKKAVEQAEQGKARDEVILESTGEGMIAVDQTGKVLIVNPVALKIFDITQEQANTKRIFDLYQLYDEKGELLPTEKRPIAVTLATGQRVIQICQVANSNKKIVVQLTSAPIKQNNALIGAIEVVRDVTKDKEVDRMKTEFISLASHQLRTPLSAIKWFSDMLVKGDAGELTAEQKELSQNISVSTERMIELVNGLLNISRIESGRIVIDPQPTNLKELVDGIVKELQVKSKERQQTLLVNAHDDLPVLNVDPKLIRQVFMNLLTNAIKYTPKGGEISVSISRKDDQIISQVTDNGYGIPKSQQDKIFQKFFRADNILKVETDGTGLGLYLIKAIVDSSQGKIWFTSEEGKGTSFFFSLPISGMLPKKGEVTLDE